MFSALWMLRAVWRYLFPYGQPKGMGPVGLHFASHPLGCGHSHVPQEHRRGVGEIASKLSAGSCSILHNLHHPPRYWVPAKATSSTKSNTQAIFPACDVKTVAFS